MVSVIYEMQEGVPGIREKAIYYLPPKEALICYIKQYLQNDSHTWDYPAIIDGMKESSLFRDYWRYEVPGRGIILNAISKTGH